MCLISYHPDADYIMFTYIYIHIKAKAVKFTVRILYIDQLLLRIPLKDALDYLRCDTGSGSIQKNKTQKSAVYDILGYFIFVDCGNSLLLFIYLSIIFAYITLNNTTLYKRWCVCKCLNHNFRLSLYTKKRTSRGNIGSSCGC